jgi:hypothetical protein
LKDNILVIHHRDNITVALRTLAGGVPGISSIDTIANTHFEASVGARGKGLKPVTGRGKWEDSDMRKEVEETALMGGPDFVVQALVGIRRQLIGLTSGHPVAVPIMLRLNRLSRRTSLKRRATKCACGECL